MAVDRTAFFVFCGQMTLAWAMVWHIRELALPPRKTHCHVRSYCFRRCLCRSYRSVNQVRRRILRFVPQRHRHRTVRPHSPCGPAFHPHHLLTHRFRTTSGPMFAIAPCSSSGCQGSPKRSRCHRFLTPPPKVPYRPPNAPAAPTRAAGLAAAPIVLAEPYSWSMRMARSSSGMLWASSKTCYSGSIPLGTSKKPLELAPEAFLLQVAYALRAA